MLLDYSSAVYVSRLRSRSLHPPAASDLSAAYYSLAAIHGADLSRCTWSPTSSKHLDKLGGREIVNKSTKYKDIVSANSQLHGWEGKDQAGSFSLNVLSLGDLNVKIGQSE
jgi:hypothetical protein